VTVKNKRGFARLEWQKLRDRNASWANSHRRYDAAYGVRRADDLAADVAFFEARNGLLYGFRWRD